MAAPADFPAEFLSLEADFVDCKIAINNSIGDVLRGRATTVSNASPIVQARVVEAQRYIKLMTVEVRGRPLQLKRAMQTKINLYREELQGLIRDVERAQLMAQKDKVASSSAGNHMSQYERLVKNNDRLTMSTKKLEETHRIVAETEEVGISVLDTMAQQRETLLGTHEKVRETGAMTTEARRVLQRMTRRIITNTIVLYTTIFALIVTICYVLYADFIRVTRLF
uniref:Vesicle transport v-SNARE N-terminal domain-containing protein n=1 Tax=Peronospora matthiolae TaxID=2874970 RepID=A0AAV1V2F7_9STRA